MAVCIISKRSSNRGDASARYCSFMCQAHTNRMTKEDPVLGPTVTRTLATGRRRPDK
jgi:hypothetical protein